MTYMDLYDWFSYQIDIKEKGLLIIYYEQSLYNIILLWF